MPWRANVTSFYRWRLGILHYLSLYWHYFHIKRFLTSMAMGYLNLSFFAFCFFSLKKGWLMQQSPCLYLIFTICVRWNYLCDCRTAKICKSPLFMWLLHIRKKNCHMFMCNFVPVTLAFVVPGYQKATDNLVKKKK